MTSPIGLFEVIVLGSGIGGSTLGAILARQGVSVAIVDSAAHPRFALGESTIGETTFYLRQFAHRYDVPELAQASSSAGLREHISKRCGIKRNFGFVYQREGLEQAPEETTQCNVSAGPFGPESHLMRADVDEYLFRAAVQYGAAGLEGAPVSDVTVDDDGVVVSLSDGRSLRARYLVDATGRQSVLAKRFNLREEPPRFHTHSRTLFTHMRGVAPYAADNPSGQPTPWHQGTLHHIFDGGWMWVIPFNNHAHAESDLVSVGLNLDTRKFPERPGVNAEQEWAEFLDRFPGIAVQFSGAVPALPWMRTGRTQFSSRQTVGDRWCLMSHAAGAIDALFSRGMANTMAVIDAFVPRLLAGLRGNDLSAEAFAYVDEINQRILDSNDKLIAGSYISFCDFDLWRAWSKVWFWAWNLGSIRVTGSYYKFLETGNVDHLDGLHRNLAAPGAFFPEMPSSQQMFEDAFAIMLDVEAGRSTAAEAVHRLSTLLDGHESSPAPLRLGDVLRRWHDGSVEAQERLYAWGRHESAPELRPYFDYDRATVKRAADLVLGRAGASRDEVYA